MASSSTTAVPYAGSRSRDRRALALVLLTAGVVVTVLASLAFGARNLAIGDVVDALLHGGDGDAAVIVRDLRIPRTIIGVAIGISLGLAGALVQAVTRNPLADPGLLGVHAGASAAVVTAIAVFGITTPGGYVWFALAGAAVASVGVYAIGAAGRAGATPIRLVLAGAAVTAALQAYIEALTLIDPKAFDSFRSWRVGAIAGRELADLLPALPFLVVGALLAVGLARSLNALALGEDSSRALGANVTRTRILSALAVTLLCGAATAVAGPIAFVGLTVPYVARLLFGVDQRWVLATAMPLGVILILGSDTLGRILGAPGELQVGIVTAFVGGPVFVALVRRKEIPHL